MSQPAEKTSSAHITITFPDGATRTYPAGITGLEIADSISKSLAKATVAVKVNGELWDAKRAIEADATLNIIKREDADGLELIRHDCAHILAEAVQELFPGTQVTIGPVIENGFYYDFARPEPFSTEDLEKIEKKMHDIVDANENFEREVWVRDDAIKHFSEMGEAYKAELIRDLPQSETITIYRQGKWHDLCRGPHMVSTKQIGHAFKLMKVAGAYWRGNSDNAMLTRIYGTAWRTEEDLQHYLTMLEEAEKRDHRKIGQDMGLFHLQPEAQGSVFWHPKGYMLWRQLEAYMRRRLDAADYMEVKTPQLMDAKQWEQSGHWGKYRENMFAVPDVVPNTDEDGPIFKEEPKDFMALKPMNCPAHVLIFRQGIKSYRDLPIRMAEFGCCHRNEPHGALHGIMRVRQFTQDDAHIFVREDQLISEIRSFCDLLDAVYKDLGFEKYAIKLALRPEKRFGSDEMWDKSEQILREAVREAGRNTEEYQWEELEGEGAFYAPKLEFHLTDAIGRTWQVGTIQADTVLPERLDAFYIGEDGERHRPVMLHRAILGTFERFIGILIEHHAGRFPLWLSPVQAVVATIVSDADSYAKDVVAKLEAAGIRVEPDLRNEKINYKIREHSLQKVPVLFVVGKREAEEGTVAIRRLGSQEQEIAKIEDAVAQLVEDCKAPF